MQQTRDDKPYSEDDASRHPDSLHKLTSTCPAGHPNSRENTDPYILDALSL